MGHTLEDPEENSLFFHPYFVEQERADLQQELVMIFNKIIDISSEDELQSAAKDMARVALISPNIALTKAVYEGVKSAGHSKSICCVSVYVQSSLHYWPTLHNGHFFGRQSTLGLLFKALYNTGADPGFFLGGSALVSCSTSTPINHIVFFFAEYQLY